LPTTFADRRAEEYPAPSPAPRNLLTFTRWSNCRAPQHHFGECGNGQPRPLPDKLAKTSIESCGTEAKLDLTLPFIDKKGDVSIKAHGF
jgi:hypothetical protein